MVDEKVYAKILEWMEKINGELANIRDILLDHSQKIETLFEIVQEMRDDMRFIKRTVNAHDDDIATLKNQFQELSKSLHP